MSRDLRMAMLGPDRVARLWPHLREYISQIFINPSEYLESNVLFAIQKGTLEVFLMLDVKEDLAFDVLSLSIIGYGGDALGMKPAMVLYGFAAIKEMDLPAYRYGIEWMKKYSSGKKCTELVAITKDRRVAGLARMLGAKTEYSMIWEIN